MYFLVYLVSIECFQLWWGLFMLRSSQMTSWRQVNLRRWKHEMWKGRIKNWKFETTLKLDRIIALLKLFELYCIVGILIIKRYLFENNYMPQNFVLCCMKTKYLFWCKLKSQLRWPKQFTQQPKKFTQQTIKFKALCNGIFLSS